MKRNPIIAGNWKMYKTAVEAKAYLTEFIPLIAKSSCAVFLGVPFTALHAAAEAADETSILIGAQNMSDAEEGAYTGEISAAMIQEAGGQFVILGHSERRQLFHETDTFIHRKLKKALQHRLLPLLCIGETREEREKGHTEKVLAYQLEGCLKDLKADELVQLVIAYEPVWAIGTGETATPEIAQETHAFCRAFLAKHWGKAIADVIRILYGGSVKQENIQDLMRQDDIDGALVGGASLNPQTFARIVNFHH